MAGIRNNDRPAIPAKLAGVGRVLVKAIAINHPPGQSP